MGQGNFADVLMDRVVRKESQLVVGLDPRLDRLPGELRPAQVSPESAAEAIVAFNRAVVDAVREHALGIKCQAAFFEQWGCEGMAAYAGTLRYAREKGLIVIGDVKRGDISSTAEAYAAAHLGPAEGGAAGAEDFAADAVTVNAYLGSDGVLPFLEVAAANGRGVFALVKTSNPSSVEIQNLESGGRPLYEHVGALVERWGSPHRGRSGYSLLGAVVGATFREELRRMREMMPHTPFLVPGLGAQGGTVDDVVHAFDADGLGAIVNSARDVIFAWERSPYRERYGPARWRQAVEAAASDTRQQVWNATH